MLTQDAPRFIEKRLSPRERGIPEAIARLRSEATLLARLGPTGIVPALLAHGADERGPWHRLAWVPFPTVAARIEAAGGPLDPAWLERAVHASFAALMALHEARDPDGPLGVVHADLSPGNLAIDDAGTRAVVLDFDLAWWREGPSRSDGAFRGTVGYVAPEIARGERPTVGSDLFALAASLLHAATGTMAASRRPRNEHASFAAVLAAAAEVPLLGREHEELPARGPGHAALVACAAHELDARPRSAREVLERLGAAPDAGAAPAATV